MFKELLAICKKNMQRLLSKPVSASALLVGPFLVMILVGFAFNSADISGVVVGMQTNKNALELSQGVKEVLEDKNFKVIEYVTKDTCVKDVKKSKIHLCMTFLKNESAPITFYVDYSRLNLVYVLISTISGELEVQEKEISMNLVQDMLDQVNKAVKVIEENQGKISGLKGRLQDSESELNKMQKNIEEFSFSASIPSQDIKNSIEEQKIIISSGKSDIVSRADSSKDSLLGFKSDLEESKKEIQDAQSDIDKGIFQVEAIRKELDCNNMPTPGCSELDQIKKELLARKAKLQTTEQKLDDGIKEIDSSVSDLESAKIKAVQQADASLNELNKAERKVFEMTGSVKSTQADVQKKKQEMIKSIKSFAKSSSEVNAELDTVINSIDSISSSLGDAKALTPKGVVNPLATEIKPLEASRSALEYLFPTVLSFVIMFIAILLASTLVLRERISKAFFRNRISPTKDYTFVAGTFLTSFGILFGQIVVMLIAGILFFDVSIASSMSDFLSSIIAIFIPALLFLLMGMIIGYLSGSEESSTLISIILASILFIFSGVVAPVEKMAPFMGALVKFNPFFLAQDSLRKVMIYNATVFELASQILILAVLAVVLGILVIATEVYETKSD